MKLESLLSVYDESLEVYRGVEKVAEIKNDTTDDDFHPLLDSEIVKIEKYPDALVVYIK